MTSKDINVNSEIVLAIADRMEVSCRLLKKNTDDFKGRWMAVRASFDDTSKQDIERVIDAATSQIDNVIKNQQASKLMRKYIDALRGNGS